jgi:trehalose/maltose hydrolase-like predicted phosphorylase
MGWWQSICGLSILVSGLSGAIVASQNESSQIYPTRFDNVTWDDTNWRIETTVLDQAHYQSRMSLANGYFGVNCASLGPFYEIDDFVSVWDEANVTGWPLFTRRQTFATIAGFYNSEYFTGTAGTNFPWLDQYGNESVISGIPHWSNLYVQVGDATLNASVDASQISNFSSTLDIKSGLLSWSFIWSPSSSSKIQAEYTAFVHKLYLSRAAVQGRFTALTDTNLTVIDALEGDGAVRTNFVQRGQDSNHSLIWSAVSPTEVSNVTAFVFSALTQTGVSNLNTTVVTSAPWIGGNESSIAQTFDVSLNAGETAEFTKFVGAASSDAFGHGANSTARNAALLGVQLGWAQMLKSHAAEWAVVLTPDSVDSYRLPDSNQLPDDPNILDLQINAITNPFHLLQNAISDNALMAANNQSDIDSNSISVCGLGSDCYAGMIFWDAEAWMAPGLAVSHPQSVRQISKYRQKLLPEAMDNIFWAFESSQNATGKFSGGAAYPWTSSRFGNCTGTGPCFDYEYHLNGDIGLQLMHYYVATGDTDFFKENLFPIFDAVAYFFGELVEYNETAKGYSLRNATDPDEYANHINEPGFTIPLIESHLTDANALRERFGMARNATWDTIAGNLLQPVAPDAPITLEYADMNGTISVKQADIVLIPDFLNLKTGRELSDLDYYAGRQSQNGPGMTFGVFSVVANEFSPSGCSSYTYDLYGSQPYARSPFFQYSEQLVDGYYRNNGTHPAYPFMTGMGGANRVTVFGFLGLRLMLETFNIDPSLPPQLQYLKYRTIYWQGHAVQAESNATHTSLTRLAVKLSVANSTFDTAPFPVIVGFRQQETPPPPIYLYPNSTVVVPNRQIGYNRTTNDNIAQCRPATSPQQYMPGQFPLAAIDGAISTKWQPKFKNETSYVVVELNDADVGAAVSAFTFDFGQSPPDSLVVEFTNSSADFSSQVIQATNLSSVNISSPYDAAAALEVIPYTGNSTTVTLDSPVYAGKYARLGILGNQGYVAPSIIPMNQSTDWLQGATVAEWTIISAGSGRTMPLSPVLVPLTNS